MNKALAYILLCIILPFSTSQANENILEHCDTLQLKKEAIHLAENTPSLVIIHNITSSTNLWITHPILQPSASAGWSSHLHPKHWSILSLHETPFEISCVESKPGHEQQVACTSVITICRWAKTIKFKSPPGTFWLAEDLTKKQINVFLKQKTINHTNEISQEKQ